MNEGSSIRVSVEKSVFYSILNFNYLEITINSNRYRIECIRIENNVLLNVRVGTKFVLRSCLHGFTVSGCQGSALSNRPYRPPKIV